MKIPCKKMPTPDFIWASPPCTTYSFAAIWYKHRSENGSPLTSRAKEADEILKRTLRIIRYFKKQNPKLKYCIENPRGYMRRLRVMQNHILNTTSYNQYGFPVGKPTDFWTNFELTLKPPVRMKQDLRICGSNTKAIRSRMKKSKHKHLTTTLGRIPPRLVRKILTSAFGDRTNRN